jgi:hypothetical protein
MQEFVGVSVDISFNDPGNKTFKNFDHLRDFAVTWSFYIRSFLCAVLGLNEFQELYVMMSWISFISYYENDSELLIKENQSA